jgi:phage shock protein PspC (stress-responsive transcriptional regulator)
MYAQAQTVYSTMQRSRGVICGVCARLGERSGVPVIVIRVAAVILLLAHALATFIIYMIAAAWMRRPQAGTWREFGSGVGGGSPGPGSTGSWGPASPAPPVWDQGGLMNRFERLDERLARMEAEAFHSEVGLRRAFRDLERHP